METQDAGERIKREYRKRRFRQYVWTLPLLPALVVALLWEKDGQGLTLGGVHLMPIVVGLAILGALFTLWNWRCPACRRLFGKRMNPRRCPYCGVELR
jgi:hypothetical protein